MTSFASTSWRRPAGAGLCIWALVACCVLPAVVADGAPPHPATAAASGEVVLLDFSAAWCGPCRQMAPLIGEIGAAGWVVRHVDVDRETDLVRRFGVTGVPCYVLLVKGHEVGRINGATTRGELEKLLAKSAAPLGGQRPDRQAAAATPPLPGIPLATSTPPAALVTEPPVAPRPSVTPAAPAAIASAVVPTADAVPPVELAAAIDEEFPAGPAASLPAVAGETRAALEQMLLQATARLRVEDGQGVSWGTGTVIDCRQGEALILTCGHIFRDSQGKGRIAVDLFAPGAARGIAGQLVAYDLTRDLALVSVFTETTVTAVRVGDAETRTTAGDPVVTVGCNGGSDPTIHHSRVTAVDKYLGPPNVQVAGQPVQGRSGGGLFAIDGTLIGVCNAADPADNEGLFAALPAIHEQLEEAGLAFVYRTVYPSGGIEGVAAVDAAAGGGRLPLMPEEMPAVSFDRRDRADAVPTASTGPMDVPAAAAAASPPPAPRAAPVRPAPPVRLSPGEQALIDHVRQQGADAEVICIVRPRGAAEDDAEVFVLKTPPPAREARTPPPAANGRSR